MTRKTLVALAGTVLAGVALTGCSARNVDIDAAGATPVPGAHGL